MEGRACAKALELGARVALGRHSEAWRCREAAGWGWVTGPRALEAPEGVWALS